MIRILTLTLILSLGTLARAETLTSENTASIVGPIGFAAALRFSSDLVEKGAQMATAKADHINIVIDSPGGSTIAGGIIADAFEALRSEGLKVNCFVPHMAASLAFQILLHCDTRTGLEGSLYLWHRARVMFRQGDILTGPAALTLAKELLKTDDELFADILKFLPGDEAVIRAAYEAETLHSARGLQHISPKFLRISHYIPGLLDVLQDTKVLDIRKYSMGLKYNSGELVCMKESK